MSLPPATIIDANRLARARLLAATSFAVNLGSQTYGMLATPNMKDVAEANHYAFSPNPWFIAAFFGAQMVLQSAWIRQLFTRKEHSAAALDAIPYVNVYALGNLCIAGWTLSWLNDRLALAHFLVTVNTVAHMYALTMMLPPLTKDNMLTHTVAKTTAGIGILDFFDNGAVMLRYAAPPSTVVKGLSLTSFGLLALSYDPLFALCLVYDLIGLGVGQSGRWAAELFWMAGGVGVVATTKLLLFAMSK